MAKKTNDLSHTKWMCKYHIVFTPKYRRKIIYNQYKADIRDIIKQLCSYKGVEIIEGHLMPDHIHMLVSIPPKYSVSSFMGYLKGKSALMIFDKHANLKYRYGNREFWCRGYYVDAVRYNPGSISRRSQPVAFFTGMVNVKQEPLPGVLSTEISPPCSLAMRLTIDNPSPVPLSPVREVSTR